MILLIMGIILDVIYAAGLVVASPVWLYRMIRHGRYRSGLGEKFGAAPIRYGLQPVIWIHAVSLGEINACRALVAQIHSQLPDYRVAISTTTDTGMAAARKLFAPDHWVFFYPLDFTWSVARALGRIRPSLIVLMEGDVWPNFLAACNRRDIPVAVVNARMSANKGYPRYKKLGAIARNLIFKRLAAVGVQDETYLQRFVELGTPADRVHLTGMLKYDSAQVADKLPGQEALAAAVGLAAGETLIVAGGTGEGEEQIVLDAFGQVRAKCPAARLAIVPRKPERFDEVARLIESHNLPLVRRSQRPDGSSAASSPGAVILGDTMGELRKFYALAACVFVGRSLVPDGGSDMIEAAALGKPTCFGPHTFNFPQADDLASHGCVRVADGAALAQQLIAWLADPAAATAAAQSAQQYVRTQQGATQRNVQMLCRVLGRTPAIVPGAIATDKIMTA